MEDPDVIERASEAEWETTSSSSQDTSGGFTIAQINAPPLDESHVSDSSF